MKKLLVVGVIVLFLGLAIAPSINANIKELSVNDTIMEVSTLIEEDEEDCGCFDDSSELEWKYPVICTLLYPIWLISVAVLYLFHFKQFVDIMDSIGIELNCFWA